MRRLARVLVSSLEVEREHRCSRSLGRGVAVTVERGTAGSGRSKAAVHPPSRCPNPRLGVATTSVSVRHRTERSANHEGSLNSSPPVGGAQCGRTHAGFPQHWKRPRRSAMGRFSWCRASSRDGHPSGACPSDREVPSETPTCRDQPKSDPPACPSRPSRPAALTGLPCRARPACSRRCVPRPMASRVRQHLAPTRGEGHPE